MVACLEEFLVIVGENEAQPGGELIFEKPILCFFFKMKMPSLKFPQPPASPKSSLFAPLLPTSDTVHFTPLFFAVE